MSVPPWVVRAALRDARRRQHARGSAVGYSTAGPARSASTAAVVAHQRSPQSAEVFRASPELGERPAHFDLEHFIGQERTKAELVAHLEAAVGQQGQTTTICLASAGRAMGKHTLVDGVARHHSLRVFEACKGASPQQAAQAMRGIPNSSILVVNVRDAIGASDAIVWHEAAVIRRICAVVLLHDELTDLPTCPLWIIEPYPEQLVSAYGDALMHVLIPWPAGLIRPSVTPWMAWSAARLCSPGQIGSLVKEVARTLDDGSRVPDFRPGAPLSTLTRQQLVRFLSDERVLCRMEAHGKESERRRRLAATKPAPRLIRRAEDAEAASAVWMRWLGANDAEVTERGADGGVDVRSRHWVAQVKAEAVPTGAPAVRALHGAAAAERRAGLFFSLAGYTQPALRFAELAGIAAFSFDLQGEPVAVSGAARSLWTRAEASAQVTAVQPPGPLTMSNDDLDDVWWLVMSKVLERSPDTYTDLLGRPRPRLVDGELLTQVGSMPAEAMALLRKVVLGFDRG